MKARKELEIGILYLCIHNKLCERTNFSRIYPKKEFFRMLGETFHVPKKMRVIVLKEMVNKKLIKDLGNRRNNNIMVEKIEFDLEKDASKFYEWLGLY
jgi:hypothetical protein|tara:strand:- start:14 stop:307 length:294 start_codon:yes stop_codon:yes gene_type:complete